MQNEVVQLGDGGGGSLTAKLIDQIFFSAYQSKYLNQGNDAADIGMDSNHIAVSTDSFVITPAFFNGGDIGHLAVCGTVNDVATSGAYPRYLTVAFVIEEGFSLADLKRIAQSIADTAAKAQVQIVSGDTKVVGHGEIDGIIINTTGIGIYQRPYKIGGQNLQPGDKLILSGTLGDHGIAIMADRLKLSQKLSSDAAPLNLMMQDIIKAVGASGAVKTKQGVHAFRDPTRGGLAATLNEFCQQSKVDIYIDEEKIPVKPEVEAICETLGLDILQVANEGKIVCACSAECATEILSLMPADAALIGEVTEGKKNKAYLRTAFGSTRIIDNLAGEQLPRIC
ncbi:MAG: hydrogenase expression/formation protein HypE [Coriobacteriales bacterium]|jgi:hydrogenase expression/formation protein HypE|nr:hydrogenase expression/formation protein HypE [Coriobacteriales bacterium]